ncbi:hypothetical protein ACFQ71_03055 [Streptomyces sp. NPDC056534]|uniref:hypothetical protein n=1 Tax=Streptomyces sp. NPDC056534 TaxID=3345857 RepID=UPI00367A390F
MGLATATDVTARLGRPLADELEAARVAAYLADAEALVIDWCGSDFIQHQDEPIALPLYGDQVEIPHCHFPGLKLTAVEVDGTAVLPEDWKLIGDTLYLRAGTSVGTVTLTASWGWPAPPPVVIQVICAEVIRWLAVSPGTISEKTGELEVEYAQTAADAGLSHTAKASLRRFRRQARSIHLRRSVTPF